MSPTLFSTAPLIGDGATMTTRYAGSVVLSFAAGAIVVDIAQPVPAQVAAIARVLREELPA